MRIGIDARMIDNTGIGRYLRNLLQALAQLDCANEYFIFINPDNSQLIEQKNVHFIPFSRYIPVYSLQEQYYLPLEFRKWRLNLVHYPNFAVPLRLFSPNIVTIHDLIYYLYPKQCPSRFAYWYAWLMMHYVTRQAEVLITDSEYSRLDLHTHFRVPLEKIHVIFPAADRQCTTCSQMTSSLLQQYGTEKPYIVYVGKHHPYKNIRALLYAYNTHPEVYDRFQLVIAGKRDSRRSDLYATADMLETGEQIIFTDFVPEEELFALYQGASLFVFPSLYEGFGLPPLEAMACGVPVISSNAASLPEVVGDAAIQVDPLDIQSLADAIRRVLTDVTLSNSLKQKGLRQAQKFSWEQSAKQLLYLYEQLGSRKAETR